MVWWPAPDDASRIKHGPSEEDSMRRKPDHPFIDIAISDTIDFVVTREHTHNMRKVVQRAARRVGGTHGMRPDEVRWIVRTVCHRLGVHNG